MSYITLHPTHGVNPTILQCPVCGKDGDLLLLGIKSLKITGREEAPMHLLDDKPCKDCQDRDSEYLKRDADHFIIHIVQSEEMPRPLATFYTSLQDVKKWTHGVDYSHRRFIMGRVAAEQAGFDFSKAPG